MPTEREIKLRYDSADEAREQILALGAAPLLGRRLQEDCLFDTEDERLRRERSTLRMRSEGGKALLTWKGPVIEGVVKIREEYETVVADGAVLQTILEELGLHIWFRYEKYREEFTMNDVTIAIDETPVGVFVEIEGGEDAIHETAAALGVLMVTRNILPPLIGMPILPAYLSTVLADARRWRTTSRMRSISR